MTDSTPIATTTHATATPAATRYFDDAWGAYRANLPVFVVATLGLFMSWVALELSVISLYRFGFVVNVLLHLAFAVFAGGLVVGFHAMALDALAGGRPNLARFVGSLDRGPSYLIALFVHLVAVVAGLVLLVAPGVLVAVRHALIAQVLATRPASPLEALRNAGDLSRGHWWLMFRVFALAVALNIGGAALLGFGLLVSFPVSVLAVTSLYRTLAHGPESTAG